jgi:hypothetical protein
VTPGLWLSFQLDWDPFLQVFRVLSLFPGKIERIDSIRTLLVRKSVVKPVHLIFIDEAQEDLQFQLVEEKDIKLLTAAMIAVCAAGLGVHFLPAIFAGTSFNAPKDLKAGALVVQLDKDSDFSWVDRNYILVGNFPLVMNNSDAKTVMQAHGLKLTRILYVAVGNGKALW